MITELNYSTIGLQTVHEATELLTIQEVSVIGVLLFIVVLLIGAIVYLYKKNDEMHDVRLQDQKDYTKDLLMITEKTAQTVTQVNEILKVTQRHV